MKRLLTTIISICFVFICCNYAQAVDQGVSKSNHCICKADMKSDTFTEKSNIVIEKKDPLILAKSGCCSWHGGVCGCHNGRVVCCDGKLSPSCTCLY